MHCSAVLARILWGCSHCQPGPGGRFVTLASFSCKSAFAQCLSAEPRRKGAGAQREDSRRAELKRATQQAHADASASRRG